MAFQSLPPPAVGVEGADVAGGAVYFTDVFGLSRRSKRAKRDAETEGRGMRCGSDLRVAVHHRAAGGAEAFYANISMTQSEVRLKLLSAHISQHKCLFHDT